MDFNHLLVPLVKVGLGIIPNTLIRCQFDNNALNDNDNTLPILHKTFIFHFNGCFKSSFPPNPSLPRLKPHTGRSNINRGGRHGQWTPWQDSVVVAGWRHDLLNAGAKCKAAKHFDGSGAFEGPRLESQASTVTNRCAATTQLEISDGHTASQPASQEASR